MSRVLPLLITCLFLFLALPVSAAEPVEVVVEGVEDQVLDKVGLALARPPGRPCGLRFLLNSGTAVRR